MRKVCLIGCLLVLAGAANSASSLQLQTSRAGSVTVSTARPSQVDPIPLGNWAYAAVARLQEKKILLGYPKWYFSGEAVRSRLDYAVAVNRCINAILPFDLPPGNEPGDVSGFGPAAIPAEDLRLIRKLSLEFKPELIAMGLDWKAADTHLLSLQDKRLHTDVAEALAAAEPKPDKADDNSMFRDVEPWIYDAIKQLKPKSSGYFIDKHILTYWEAAVAVKRLCDGFRETEDGHSSGSWYYRAASTYDLNDVVALHKLVRTFHAEWPQLGLDMKPAEAILAKAEEKRIHSLETINNAQYHAVRL